MCGCGITRKNKQKHKYKENKNLSLLKRNIHLVKNWRNGKLYGWTEKNKLREGEKDERIKENNS